MSEGVVAKRYAQAVFELGVETGTAAVLAEKLRLFADAYAVSHALRVALSNPLVPKSERKAALSAVARRLGVPDLGLKALLVMADRRRLSVVGAVAAALTELVDQKQGVLRASVTTAKKMPETYYQTLSQKLAAATGQKVVLERREDPALIAGAVARVGDLSVDASVRGHLTALERRLHAALSAATS